MPQNLSAADRCDYCGAPAFVLTRHVRGTLRWCAHHFRKNETALRNAAVWIHDERDRLEEVSDD